MRIRLVQDKDYAGIARLHRMTIRNINSKDYSQDIIEVWSGRTNAQRFRNSAGRYKRWVAVENDKVVGFIEHGVGGEVDGLYVHKDYIGKGIGGRLLKIAEDSLGKQGVKDIKIKSTITAKDFYVRQGYKVIKKTLHPIKDKKVEIYIMEKSMKGTSPD